MRLSSSFSNGIFGFLGDSGVEGHDRRQWRNVDVSRKHQRENRRGKGQDIGVSGGPGAGREGQGIQADHARVSRERGCETGDPGAPQEACRHSFIH